MEMQEDSFFRQRPDMTKLHRTYEKLEETSMKFVEAVVLLKKLYLLGFTKESLQNESTQSLGITIQNAAAYIGKVTNEVIYLLKHEQISEDLEALPASMKEVVNEGGTKVKLHELSQLSINLTQDTSLSVRDFDAISQIQSMLAAGHHGAFIRLRTRRV